MIVEYYDIRTDKTEDYGLNINDNTPLLILALWHHYNATGDEDFLREVYPAARQGRALHPLAAQRAGAGLVHARPATSDWGIVGWRNVINNYRLSGATTEVNSECFAALRHRRAHGPRAGRSTTRAPSSPSRPAALKEAINTHLYNPDNGLYYLNIDLDGTPRSDVTSDLVFPVMFGVAADETAARIISRLSSAGLLDRGRASAPRRATRRTTARPEPARACWAASGSA